MADVPRRDGCCRQTCTVESFAMSSVSSERRLLRPEEVAARLGLSRRTVVWKIKSGELPAFQLGGKGSAFRVDERELDDWLESEPAA
jgi:excisionase family DNA binding protein